METNVCNVKGNAGMSQLDKNPAQHEATIVDINGIKVGGNEIVVMAGPCAVENWEQLFETARVVKNKGAKILRGGAFKPRSSPHSFQGLGTEGLQLLRLASKETGLPIVTEVMDTRQVELVAEFADLIQIGSRNMQNFPLLKEVGMCKKPVLLKRGMMATIDEFLLAAEYITNEGNNQVILCERGIRTYETSTRNTLDLNAVPVLKKRSTFPVIVDPSHGTGYNWMVPPMAKAAIAAGADGLIIEVHYHPKEALCDGNQSLNPDEFAILMKELKKIVYAIDRTM